MQRVSTENVPRPQRLAYVHDFIARNWAGMRFTPLDPDDLHIDIAVFDLPDAVGIARAHYPPIIGHRPRDLLSDGRDNYTLAIVSDDHEVSIEGCRDFTVKAGDLMLINEGTCFEVRHQRPTTVDVVSLGCSQIAARVPRLDLAPFYHIPASAPGVSLFLGYANLLRQAPPQGGTARQTAANHIHDLIALVLDGFVPGRSEWSERGVRAARLGLIKADIQKHLTDFTLSINVIAQRQCVTPRYVQHLFESDGTTFTEFLRNSRLELAYRRLHESLTSRSISTIALECGFSDLSNFNRAFRRRYGMTPSNVRAGVMRQRSR